MPVFMHVESLGVRFTSIIRAMTNQERRGPDSVSITLPDGSTSTVLLSVPPVPTGPTVLNGHRTTTTTDTASEAAERAERPKPLVMIWPGFGMGAYYYRPIATYLAEQGFPAAIGELRGQGSSTAIADRHHQWGYHTLVCEDYPLSIRAAKEALGLDADHPVILLCHSMGGQIGALFLSSPQAAELGVVAMMGVGAGSPYWRDFVGRTRARIRGGVPVMDITSRLLGYWPKGRLDIAGYGRQSGVHVREWANFARTNSISHIEGGRYDAALAEVAVPVLLTRCVNDEDCTLASARSLARLLPPEIVMVEELDEELGHNRWAREPEAVGQRLIRFWEQARYSSSAQRA